MEDANNAIRRCSVYTRKSSEEGVCGELLISPESAIRHTQRRMPLSCQQ